MLARSPIPSLSLAARNIVPLRLGMYRDGPAKLKRIVASLKLEFLFREG